MAAGNWVPAHVASTDHKLREVGPLTRVHLATRTNAGNVIEDQTIYVRAIGPVGIMQAVSRYVARGNRKLLNNDPRVGRLFAAYRVDSWEPVN